MSLHLNTSLFSKIFKILFRFNLFYSDDEQPVKLMNKVLTGSLLSILIIGCATSKGYLGEKLPDSELAIIDGGSNILHISGKRYEEKVLIAKVDSLEVGNFYKGWPKSLKVKPGEHIVEVRHFRPWTYSNTYWGGGAIGGAIAGSTNENRMTHHHYLLKFTVEKNQSYLIDNPNRYIPKIPAGERIMLKNHTLSNL